MGRVNRCSGEPAQKWIWTPDAHGRSMIQLKGTNECLDASPGDSSVRLRPCEEKVTESWKLEEAMPVPKAGMDNVMMSLLAMASVGALSMGVWLWRRHGKVHAVTPRSAVTPTRHADVHMMATPGVKFNCNQARGFGEWLDLPDEEKLELKNGRPYRILRGGNNSKRGFSQAQGWQFVKGGVSYSGEITEELLDEAEARAVPWVAPEEELGVALSKTTTVEDVNAAIAKCLENGGRKESDVVKNADKMVKGAGEDGSVTPAKAKAKAKGKSKAKAFAWPRSVAKRHDNSR